MSNKIRHFQVLPPKSPPENKQPADTKVRDLPQPTAQKSQTPAPNLATTPKQSNLVAPSPAENQKKSYLGWWIAGSILLAVGIVSQIRVQPSIRAEAWLEADPEARQMIHMEIPGLIKEILVVPNQSVQIDQPLAMVESEQIEAEIGNWTLRLQENLATTESAKQQMFSAQARLNQSQQQYNYSRDRVAQLQEEIDRMNAGSPPPHIQGYQTQIANLQATEASLDDSLQRLQTLVKEGAISQEQLAEVQRRKLAIAAQIGQNRSALETAKRQLQDELKVRTDELNRLQNAVAVAQQEYLSAQAQVNSRQPIQAQIQQELDKRTQQKQETHVLRTAIAGTVVTQNLFALQGKTLQPGEVVMEIADPAQLVAIIEVRQEDRDLVRAGSKVRFKPLEPGLPSFTTTIEEIITVLERNEQLQKSTLQVTALINSTEGKLQPGAKVYATIKSPQKIPLYEQARREILNLFKFRKYS